MTQKIGFDPDGNYRGALTNTTYVLPFFFNLADIAATGDVLTNYLIGHKFAILGVDFRVCKAASTAAKLATLALKITSVSVTGGSVAMTSANATPAGVAIAGTAVTALNTGTATDTLTIAATGVTAFVEGSGWLLIKIQNLD